MPYQNEVPATPSSSKKSTQDGSIACSGNPNAKGMMDDTKAHEWKYTLCSQGWGHKSKDQCHVKGGVPAWWWWWCQQYEQLPARQGAHHQDENNSNKDMRYDSLMHAAWLLPSMLYRTAHHNQWRFRMANEPNTDECTCCAEG
jgi:hypothetical protein